MTGDRSQGRIPLFVSLAVLLGLGWWMLMRTTRDSLVVYCAHDLMFAEDVLRDFERKSGIPVVIVGDTEATKSLGLVQRLIREKDAPVCDVFWNNQMLGTVQLAEEGVLESYQGVGWKRMPGQFKDEQGRWTGFGGRLRVWIVSSARKQGTPDVFDDTGADLFAKMGVAMPMFGTTLSHYAVLWDQLGKEGLLKWHARFIDHEGTFVPGNAAVKDLVAAGALEVGMTDTDDYFLAQDAQAPVRMFPIRTPHGETICIPNTVAIIRGTEKRSEAERLVDYLTSQDSELRMARSPSRQIPLGPVDPADIPGDVRPLVDWAGESVDLRGLSEARQDCLDWLKEEFAP